MIEKRQTERNNNKKNEPPDQRKRERERERETWVPVKIFIAVGHSSLENCPLLVSAPPGTFALLFLLSFSRCARRSSSSSSSFFSSFSTVLLDHSTDTTGGQ